MEELFSNQASAVGRRGTKIDRLARSVTHLWEIVKSFEGKGVALKILGPDLDTSSSVGRLILSIMGGIAEFERSMMLEQQPEEIAKAKADGRYKGRKPTARARADEVKELAAQGLSMGAIALQIGIGKGSVHRILSVSLPHPARPFA